ncbi:MAG: tetratricopeptide repeat protein [Treponema sp.]|nr:tetratricopeptide repeat protein [Treponema sp.]
MIKKGRINIHISILFLLMILIYASCSSAPKKPGDVFFLRMQAEDGLEAANREAERGNFENALALLTSYKRNAILADDLSLIVRVSLARGNVFYSLGMTDEAFAEWDQALKEAALLKDSELLSVAKIFYARGNILTGRKTARAVLDEVSVESVNIKKNRLYIAFSWQVRGLALRELGLWSDAEESMKKSLAIHEKDNRLENASYDWYTIASIRSLAGDISGAVSALETSISLDRRIENSWGLASSWRALGDVFRKAGRERDALEAYKRSRSIYVDMGNDYEVEQLDRKINS